MGQWHRGGGGSKKQSYKKILRLAEKSVSVFPTLSFNPPPGSDPINSSFYSTWGAIIVIILFSDTLSTGARDVFDKNKDLEKEDRKNRRKKRHKPT